VDGGGSLKNEPDPISVRFVTTSRQAADAANEPQIALSTLVMLVRACCELF
jgi:hypothetical protein